MFAKLMAWIQLGIFFTGIKILRTLLLWCLNRWWRAYPSNQKIAAQNGYVGRPTSTICDKKWENIS